MKPLIKLCGIVVLALLCASPAWALQDMAPVTLHTSATTNATGTVVDVSRYSSIALDISITNTATVTFQSRSSSGGTYTAIQCVNLETGELVTTATASMQVQCNVAGLSQLKAPITNCSSCTVVVAGKISTAPGRGVGSGLTFDDDGNAMTAIDHTLAGEAVSDDVLKVEQRGYYVSICSSGCISTSPTTTVVKSGPGWFQGCHVVGGTLGNVTIYDNTAASGAVVVAAFTPATSDDLKSINTSFSVGLTVVTAAATNLTCVVR